MSKYSLVKNHYFNGIKQINYGKKWKHVLLLKYILKQYYLKYLFKYIKDIFIYYYTGNFGYRKVLVFPNYVMVYVCIIYLKSDIVFINRYL